MEFLSPACRCSYPVGLESEFQGGQSRGQHDWVHGFPEPVKSFITFVIQSQISHGKVQKPPSYFSAQDCAKVSPGFVVVFKITSNNWRKKRKILRDWVHTSVVQGNNENCSGPRRNFYTVLCRKIWGFFCTLPKVMKILLTCDVQLLVRIVCEPNQADHMIGHLEF